MRFRQEVVKYSTCIPLLLFVCIFKYIYHFAWNRTYEYNWNIFYFIFDLQFICDPNIINKVRTNLEKFKYDIIHAEEEHLANQKVSLNESEYELITKFINQVETLQDVIHVYDNIN